MNERIKELAEQAGFESGEVYDIIYRNYENEIIVCNRLERFAELIRLNETKACAKHYLEIMRDAVEAARLEERESCAKLCEKIAYDYRYDKNEDGYDWPDGDACAKAIRAGTT